MITLMMNDMTYLAALSYSKCGNKFV